ncbi:MAG: TerB family tellurite resistance protein [Variibacter sp.]|nr:TerB family tellurite resistance protein [Variibacter sp.]
MLESLRTLFGDLVGGTKSPDRFEDTDYRVAAAALLVHILNADGVVTERERERLHTVLRYRFALSDADTEELIREATLVEGEAVDLYHFTRLLGRALDEKGRARIVEMLWEMTYADGRASEFEDNIIWRVADLLGVSSSERIALRQQVAAAAGVPAQGSEGE